MTKQYATAVVELPADPEKRGAVLEVLREHGDFHGGRITAVCLGDAISENEIFERCANPMLLKAVRDDVARRHELGYQP